jgi:tRNA(His) 5'-end guanylyltransferase
MFMWRAMDAYKNSISMAAMAEFSHKQLTGVNGADKIEMLMKKGVDFNALPNFFKYGTFVRNESFFITAEEANIPEQFLNEENAKGFMRRRVVEVDLGNFVDVSNKVAFIFNSAEPEFKADSVIDI